MNKYQYLNIRSSGVSELWKLTEKYGSALRTVAGSKLPATEGFESWILDELVPETLGNGGYILKKKEERRNG